MQAGAGFWAKSKPFNAQLLYITYEVIGLKMAKDGVEAKLKYMLPSADFNLEDSDEVNVFH